MRRQPPFMQGRQAGDTYTETGIIISTTLENKQGGSTHVSQKLEILWASGTVEENHTVFNTLLRVNEYTGKPEEVYTPGGWR